MQQLVNCPVLERVICPVLEASENGAAMDPVEVLQGVRQMRFEGLLGRPERGQLSRDETAEMLWAWSGRSGVARFWLRGSGRTTRESSPIVPHVRHGSRPPRAAHLSSLTVSAAREFGPCARRRRGVMALGSKYVSALESREDSLKSY